MPSAAITYKSVASYNSGWIDFASNGNGYFGRNSKGLYYATVLKITTPAYAGKSASLTIKIPAVKGASSQASSISCRLSITTNDPRDSTTYIGSSPGADSGRVYSGEITFNGLTGSLQTFSFTLSAELAGNETYYIVLSANGTAQRFGQVFSANKTTGTVSYQEPASIPSVSPATVDLGGSVTISMNRASSSYTHTLKYSFKNASGTIASGVASTRTWTVPMSLANQIPNATSGVLTITCETYNGSTKIGTKTCNLTVTVPASVKPSFTCALSDAAGKLSTYGSYIQNVSKLRVQTTVTNAYSATTKSVAVTFRGETYLGATITTAAIRSNGTQLPVTVKVTDSRGRSTESTEYVDVTAYAFPKFSGIAAGRSNASGTAQGDGAYANVTFTAAVTSLTSTSQANTADYKVEYREVGAASWTTAALTTLNNIYAPTNASYIFAADTDKAYEVRIVAADSFSSRVESPIKGVPIAFVLLQANTTGTGLAIGQMATEANTFRVALPMKVNKLISAEAGLQMGGALSFLSTYTPKQFRTEQGMVKTLWSGTWESGNLTVPDTDKYTLFKIGFEGKDTCALAIKHGSYIRGYGGYCSTGPNIITVAFGASFSGNVWTMEGAKSTYHKTGAQHTAYEDLTVSSIVGIL